MKDFVCDIVSVLLSLVRFAFMKLLHYSSFQFKWIERFSPNADVKIGKNSSLILGKRISAHAWVKMAAVAGGVLQIGDCCGFSRNCAIICRYRISIGSGVIFGPNVLVYDHDHDYTAEEGIRSGKYKCDEVSIGNNCWIGANTIVLRGTKIGDNCIIGAGSVVKGIVPDNTILVQKRVNEYRTYRVQEE